MNLSANFTLRELTKSDTATRLGIDNTPDEQALENLKTLCDMVLQPVRDHFGKAVTVNSGYRSPESNAAVGWF
jgi:zinc D-Ala-D-Ala carboxypeptidase